MQLKIKRSEVGKKFRLEVRADYSDEEKQNLRKVGYFPICQVATSIWLKDVTKGSNLFGSVVTGVFPELKGFVINITAESLERGHVIESGRFEELIEVENEIRANAKLLHSRIKEANYFQGQEQVIDMETGEVVARAEPMPTRPLPPVQVAPQPSLAAPEEASLFVQRVAPEAAAQKKADDGFNGIGILLLLAFLLFTSVLFMLSSFQVR